MPRLTLNSDGRAHPLLNALAVFVLVIGLASFALGIAVRNVPHPGLGLTIPTGVTGLMSLVLGLYAQMISATREQRVLIVTGITAGFVGLAMGLANGAFGG
jgi:FtsH-binding integral membrane protein